jgi:hypothetical protein
MTDKTICRNDGRCEYAIQSGAEVEGHCPNGKCAMPQSAAHLTIPGALEWDGDNGTHGADGESRAHGESALLAAAGEHVEEHLSKQIDILAINLNSVRAQLANTEQSRRSFFDLSQDLGKRLAYMVEAMNQIVQVSSMHEKPFEIATLAIGELSAMVSAPKPYAAMSEAEADEFLSSFGGGSGNKAKRRIAEIEKAKTCTACDGSGHYDHKGSPACGACNGTGKGGDQ